MSNTLRFQGKVAFKTVISGVSQQYFLTKLRLPNRSYVPAMAASQLTSTGKCILYRNISTNNIAIQLGSLDYLTLFTEMGWIEYSASLQDAAWFQLVPLDPQPGASQTWQVLNGTQLAQISYTQVGHDLPPPMLTINADDGSFTDFAPQMITDDLDTIIANKIANKNGRGIDFTNVDLSDQDVSGVDFTQADFTGANLTNTIFDRCTLKGTIFVGATLNGTSFNGATLDQAQFSNATQVTDLSQVKWGVVKSANQVNFSGCNLQNTVFGNQQALIDFTGANLSGANVSGATLAWLNLSGANLNNLVALQTHFEYASLQGVSAHTATFTNAFFFHANLSGGAFGMKALRFSFTDSANGQYVTELNHSDGQLLPQDLLNVFTSNHVEFSTTPTVTVWIPSQSWLISDGTNSYNIIKSYPDVSQLLVFQYGGATPATFINAHLDHTTCSAANFSGATMTGVQWHFATADHTDLESTSLSNSFLLETDFTQAQLFGTILTNSILIQVIFKSAVLAESLEGVAVNLVQAQLQGADFTSARVAGGNLTGAGVALAAGVPLFVLPSSDAAVFNSGDMTQIGPLFANNQYPLGSTAKLSSNQSWTIANSANTQPPAIAKFYIDSQLNVYDDANHNAVLFQIPTSYAGMLKVGPPAIPLVQLFKQKQYPLSPQATIAINPATQWLITNSQDAPSHPLPILYEYLSIQTEGDGLHVYGTQALWVTNDPNYTNDIAFNASIAIQGAIDAQTFCPNGYRLSQQGQQTWEQMMTALLPGQRSESL